MSENARHLAFDVLNEIQMKGAYANLALDKALLHSSLNNNDRRLVTELVYGCTKMELHLDYIIKHYTKNKKVDKKTQCILRMAVYQLEFLDKIPSHAVLNEAVQLTKDVGLKTDKFVNAILHRIDRKEEKVVWPDKRRYRNQYFSKWYSFPQWLIDTWVKEYGFIDTEKLCQYFNQPAKTWLRVNTLKTTTADVETELKARDIAFKKHPLIEEAILVESLQKVQASKLIEDGKIFVQDLSSMIPVNVLQPTRNSEVLDMCAAPGGKTTYLSAIMHNSGSILACDIHEHRVGLICQNAHRLGVKNIKTLVADATRLPVECHQAFDYILLDAPCSGLGVLNRRADLRWRIRKSSLAEIEALQATLLDAAVSYLKKGGTMVYSTCTLNKSENEHQIKLFLEKHPDFELIPFEYADEQCKEGYKTIYPFADQSDGFFIAKLERGE